VLQSMAAQLLMWQHMQRLLLVIFAECAVLITIPCTLGLLVCTRPQLLLPPTSSLYSSVVTKLLESSGLLLLVLARLLSPRPALAQLVVVFPTSTNQTQASAAAAAAAAAASAASSGTSGCQRTLYLSPYFSSKACFSASADALWPPPVLDIMMRMVFCCLSRAAELRRDAKGHSRSCSAFEGPQNYRSSSSMCAAKAAAREPEQVTSGTYSLLTCQMCAACFCCYAAWMMRQVSA
jgi:hypothetical protein